MTILPHVRRVFDVAFSAPEVEFGFGLIWDCRGRDLSGHSVRVGAISAALAIWAGCSEEECVEICKGGILHDLGKVLIRKDILDAERTLSEEEWVEMCQHPVKGRRLATYRHMPLSAIVIDSIYFHHEHWNGTGYPCGRTGTDIPCVARIVAVADGFDAMQSDRSYHAALPDDKVREILASGAGEVWDSDLVRIALSKFTDLLEIRSVFSRADVFPSSEA